MQQQIQQHEATDGDYAGYAEHALINAIEDYVAALKIVADDQGQDTLLKLCAKVIRNTGSIQAAAEFFAIEASKVQS